MIGILLWVVFSFAQIISRLNRAVPFLWPITQLVSIKTANIKPVSLPQLLSLGWNLPWIHEYLHDIVISGCGNQPWIHHFVNIASVFVSYLHYEECGYSLFIKPRAHFNVMILIRWLLWDVSSCKSSNVRVEYRHCPIRLARTVLRCPEIPPTWRLVTVAVRFWRRV